MQGRRPRFYTLRDCLCLLLCASVLLFAAPAVAQRGLDRFEARGLEANLRATDWSLAGELIETKQAGLEAWVWPIIRDDEGGAVALYRVKEKARGDQVVANLDGETVALARSDTSILAVILEGQDGEEARVLLNKLMRAGAESAKKRDAFSDLVLKKGEDAPAPLPEVQIGAHSRVDIIGGILNEGWDLDRAPELTDGNTYEAVTYTFVKGEDGRVIVTFYACVSVEIARRMSASLKGRREAATLQKGEGVVVVISPGKPDVGRALLRAAVGTR